MANSENLFIMHYTNPLILIPVQITSAKLLTEIVLPRLHYLYRNHNSSSKKSLAEPQPTPPPREEILDSKLANILRHAALCVDAAIEYPLILAYHPTTLLRSRGLADVLGSTSARGSAHRIALVCLLVVVEKVIGVVVGYVRGMEGSVKSGSVCDSDDDDDDGAATNLALDFAIPRAALLVSIAVSGLAVWEGYFGGGGMDVSTLAWWVALRQIL